MILINTVDDKYFTLNGIQFARIYQPLAQGSSAIGIYSIFDTKLQLQNSTEFNQFSINGTTYLTQALTIAAILAVTYSTLSQSEFETLTTRVDYLEENQYSGVLTFKNYIDRSDGASFLPITGTLLVSYKVANDEVDPTKNGYWYWDGAAYQPQASLANGVVESGNVEAVSGDAVFQYTEANGINGEDIRFKDNMINDQHSKVGKGLTSQSMNANTILLIDGTTTTLTGWHTSNFLTDQGTIFASYQAYFDENIILSTYANICYYDANDDSFIKSGVFKGLHNFTVASGYKVKISTPDTENLYLCSDLQETLKLSKDVIPSQAERDGLTKLASAKTEYTTWTASRILDPNGNEIVQGGWQISDFISYAPDSDTRYDTYECDFSDQLSPNLHSNICYYDDTTEAFIKSSVLKGKQCISIPAGFKVKIAVPTTNKLYKCNSVVTIPEHLNIQGSKVLWIGTSISAGCTYSEAACKAAGATLINNSISGSPVSLINPTTPATSSLSATKAELITAGYPDTSSYESVIIPYIDGTLDDVDVIVFDHGYNDGTEIGNEIATINSVNWRLNDLDSNYDRSLFSESVMYVFKKIYEAKPTVKIIIGGYFEGNDETGFTIGNFKKGKYITEFQQRIADVFELPILDVWRYAGFNLKHIPSTSTYISDYNTLYGTSHVNILPDADGNITFFQRYNMDGVHPYADLTGEANKRLDNIYINLLKGLI